MAGTITLVHHTLGTVRKIVATATADSADASFPDTALPAFEGRLLHLETNPGATAPTAAYDITLIDQHGVDVLQAVGGNRSATTSEKASIVYSGTSVNPYVDASDVLTLNIDGNAVNSATLVAELAYRLA